MSRHYGCWAGEPDLDDELESDEPDFEYLADQLHDQQKEEYYDNLPKA